MNVYEMQMIFIIKAKMKREMNSTESSVLQKPAKL